MLYFPPPRQMFLKNEFKVKILKDASLKEFCTFKIGGIAKFVFIVENIYSLVKMCRYCKQNDIKFKVIGYGSNLLFSDLGFDGAIIVNRADKVKIVSKSVWADSGVGVSTLIQKCIRKRLSGIEKLAGIPSTVGGACVNSMGAFNTNFADFVEYVYCYNPQTDRFVKLTQKDCNFGYRSSCFKSNNLVIIGAKLRLKKDKKENIKARMIDAIKIKNSTQPTNYHSAGSVFKRGSIIPAKIIDELGLKGLRVNDAEISKIHAGFIVNLNSATSDDVKELISIIKQRVLDHCNQELETEIEFVE